MHPEEMIHNFFFMYFYQTLPYVSKVAGGLRQNMALFFQGIIPLNSKGYVFGFLSKSNAENPTPF